MKADHPWPEVEYQLKPLFVKTRERIKRLWHRADAELIIIDGQALAYPTRRSGSSASAILRCIGSAGGPFG